MSEFTPYSAEDGPMATRLVLFRPSHGAELISGQWTEVSYFNAYPRVVHQRDVDIFATEPWAERANRLEALVSAAEALRSR